ncbi:MAG: LD-carboxypeptidase [Acidobacteria bacterium]|nr:MAG: LD-carboxypeptidase [Acidobacteriota bacterium]
MKLIRPPRLYPGDPVAVVAASGPVNQEKFSAGVEALGGRYDLIYDESSLFARKGFLAGEDAHRLEVLNTAIRDPECRAIILARGGYGLTRILPGIDQAGLRVHPKAIVGYSDVTALLSMCYDARVASIHGPMVSDFGGLSDGDRDSLFNLLENSDPGEIFAGLETLVEGRARGRLMGGNLEVLSRLLGTPFQPNFEGAVLFLEEVGEFPYRVDRLLTHLEMAGVFESVAGILIGDFTDCDELEEGVVQPPSINDVLLERLGRLEVPVALGGAFGHGDRKRSLPVGVPVELDAGRGVLTAIEGAVS